MTILRNYYPYSGKFTADGVLRFGLNPKLYMAVKNASHVEECRDKGICTACRTERAAEGKTKCNGCLTVARLTRAKTTLSMLARNKRRDSIFAAKAVGATHWEIAQNLGISLRTITNVVNPRPC